MQTTCSEAPLFNSVSPITVHNLRPSASSVLTDEDRKLLALKNLFASRQIWPAEIAASDRCYTDFRALEGRGNIIPFGIPEIDRVFAGGGLQRGMLHELSSEPDSFGYAVPPLSVSTLIADRALDSRVSQQSSGKVAVWIGREVFPTPFILNRSSIAIENCIFVDPANTKLVLWALLYALRSPAVGVVVADCRMLEEKLTLSMTRRLTLAANSSNATALLIRNSVDRSKPSAAHSRWKVQATYSSTTDPRFELTLVSCKGSSLYDVKWQIGFGSVSSEPAIRNQRLGEQHESAKSPLSMCVFPKLVNNSCLYSEQASEGREKLFSVGAYG